jgi:ubiquinone/menaquinone biosynthesis C-methylase UbiE
MPSFSQSRFAAYLQNMVGLRRAESGLYNEIADHLPLTDTGRILDVGTGTGLQLKVLHEMRPGVEVFGLDLSAAALHIAEKNLTGIKVDLRCESIENTSFDDHFFDIVTCNASLSYWKNLMQCFNEIYRILKPAGRAIFFEPQKDLNLDEVAEIIDANLADKSRFRRFAARSLTLFGLQFGHKVGMRLYSTDELEKVAQQSHFAENHSIDRVSLQNLPIFMRITLIKTD